MHQTLCVQRGGGGVEVPKNTFSERQVILHLLVSETCETSWEASGALWDNAPAVPGPWSKPVEQVLCYLEKWRTLLRMNSALPD